MDRRAAHGTDLGQRRRLWCWTLREVRVPRAPAAGPSRLARPQAGIDDVCVHSLFGGRGAQHA